MPFHKYLLALLLTFICLVSKATTWDEPWHATVVQKADYFVLAKVVSCDEHKGVSIRLLKTLGGKLLTDTLTIKDFYLLKLCSTSANEGPEFQFKNVDSCYFFIKQTDKSRYAIATPTTGFAVASNGKVIATYRHSCHQALIDQEVYEKTMTAIFNNYHSLPYDNAYMTSFVDKHLSVKPAGLDPDQKELFFNQHVALESIYHLKLRGYYEKLLPFIRDTANMHSQISAARALGTYDSTESSKVLLSTLTDKNYKNNFVKVICVWALKDHLTAEVEEELIVFAKTASNDDTGFGGNIMDPRVCTQFPTVKEAVQQLLQRKG